MSGEIGEPQPNFRENEGSGLHKVYEIKESEINVFIDVRKDVEHELRKFEWTEEEVITPMVAAEELVRNAITHGILEVGSEPDETTVSFRERISGLIASGAALGKSVEVWIVASPQSFELRVRDEGAVFEIKKLKKARSNEELLKTSGNGLFILQTSGDLDVEPDPQGNGKTVIFTMQRGM